ncbi:MAG TPA: peptide deformylase [Coriobacteriia bacterium]
MEILEHPNPALKQTAVAVDPTTDKGLMQLVHAMATAMYEAPGIGLAATQLGVQKRVIILDIDDGLMALCNPRISELSEETEIDDEGCLSFPGVYIPIERPVSCVCEALDLKGKPVRISAEGLFARVLQHETDHLDGMLIIDRATLEERRAALRRYREANESR